MKEFLLAGNPMKGDEGLYLVSLNNPTAIIKCVEGHKPLGKHVQHNFHLIGPNGSVQRWTLQVCHFSTNNEEKRAVGDLLMDAWQWFTKYIQWEDEQKDIHI